MVGFKKAQKQQAFLRMGVYGPSGGGKTFSSLRIAFGIARVTGGRVGFICSERGAASKYADRFDFDVLDLDGRTVDDYLDAIELARKAGFSVLIIDSTSHAWQEILESIDEIAKARFKGNKWSAWSEATPKQKAFVDALLQFPGHVIATMRAKTEWETDKDSKKPVRVGLSPEQGKGIEYEYDLLMSINADHIALVEKDRTGKYQDKIITKPGEDFGEELARWLQDGAPVKAAPALVTADQKKRMVALTEQLGVKEKPGAFMMSFNGGEKIETADQAAHVIAELTKRVDAQEAAKKQAGPTAAAKPAAPASATTSPNTDTTTSDVPDDPRVDDEEQPAAAE